jgi:hypothetical protein
MNVAQPIANSPDPSPSPTNVTTTATAHQDESESTLFPSHLPAVFEPYLSGSESHMDKETLKAKLLETLMPFGVRRLVNATGTRNNKNQKTKSLFPHRYVTWVCGTCDKDVVQKSDEENGCCGLSIHCCLQDSEDDDEPYILIKTFKLPFTSRHLKVSAEVWSENDHVIMHEDELTPNKMKLLKSLGTSRVPATKAREIMEEQYEGVKVSDQCMYRVFKKGRNEKFGALDSESMAILFSSGHKLREFNNTYGVEGKFETIFDGVELLAWMEQLPLEVWSARVYGQDAVYCDTTHNATKYKYKTGPIAVVDWGGHTAPAGMLQVPEEQIDVLVQLLKYMELDTPGSNICTDGGSAWPGIAEELKLNHVEDTYHNDKGADKKLDGMSKDTKEKFIALRKRVLYEVMDEAVLETVLQEMLQLTRSNPCCLQVGHSFVN